MKIIQYILLTLLLLVSCKGSDEEHDFDIRGVWELKCIRVPGVNEFEYTENSIVPVKVFTDSIFYVGRESASPKGFMFSPSYSGRYKLIDKGGGEYLYLEDSDHSRLTVMDDSTINITDAGRVCEWRRMGGSNKPNVSDFLDFVEQIHNEWDTNGSTFFFTEKERTLKTEKQNLTAVILCVILAFVLLAYYTRNLFQNKARIEQQLRQIREEKEARPKVVQEAMKSVEDEFLHSDFYTSIRQRISKGERLKKTDWTEIERQVNSTYAGFTSRLFTLYPMSPTEMQTCLLIKLRVPTSEIANVLSKSASAISSSRSRLYEKVFHGKGGAKEWDEFVLSL